MNKKSKIIIALGILFFSSIYYRNITTYYSMANHTGYTYGTIIKIWDEKGAWYSRYQYTIGAVTFLGRQGEKYKLQDTVLIVYDTTAPRFSMIADYPLPIELDSSKNLVDLDTMLVNYKWWDYLPGDEIHSIKDLWGLD